MPERAWGWRICTACGRICFSDWGELVRELRRRRGLPEAGELCPCAFWYSTECPGAMRELEPHEDALLRLGATTIGLDGDLRLVS